MDRIVYKSELPTFTDYVEGDKNQNVTAPISPPVPAAKPLAKGTMGNLLKDFKVEE